MKFLLTIISIIFYYSGFTQTSYIVEYQSFSNTIESKGILTITKNNPAFYSEQLVDANNKKNKVVSTKPQIQSEGSTANISIEEGKDYSRKLYQVYYKEKKELINIAYIGKEKISYVEPIPKIEWKILNEHKKIESYNCTKAKCIFRGRQYDAWFTTEIPIQIGPWKFTGLPGLILEISDESFTYLWKVSKISFTESANNLLIDNSLPKYTLKEFYQKDKIYLEKNFNETYKLFLSKQQSRGLDISKLSLDKVAYGRGRELKYEWE